MSKKVNVQSKGLKTVNHTSDVRFVNRGKPYSIFNSDIVGLTRILQNYDMDKIWEMTGVMYQEITVVGMKNEIVNLLLINIF